MSFIFPPSPLEKFWVQYLPKHKGLARIVTKVLWLFPPLRTQYPDQ